MLKEEKHYKPAEPMILQAAVKIVTKRSDQEKKSNSFNIFSPLDSSSLEIEHTL